MSVNTVYLMGRCGKDAEVRTIQGGSKVAQFSLATGSKYQTKDGHEVDDTAWHNIVAWRGNADVAERFIRKGTQLYIEGRIRTRSWDDQTGNKRYTTEIIADNLQLLGKKSDNPGAMQGGYQAPAQKSAPSYSQPAQPAYAPQPQAPARPVVDDMPEDDLPF